VCAEALFLTFTELSAEDFSALNFFAVLQDLRVC